MSTAPDHVSIIAPPLADAPPADPAADTVSASEFWPDFSISEFRKAMRVDDVVTPQRIRHAFRSAIETALLDLDAASLAWITMGYLSLEAVPALVIDGESRLVLCWQRAVYALTKAEILETHRDYDATGKAGREEDWLDDSIIQLRRDAKNAVRDMLRRPRMFAELI